MAMSLAALALGMASCSDYLDEDNKTGQTADLTYSTKSGIDGLIGSCYNFARGWYGKEAGLGLSEMGTDLFYYGYGCKQKSLCQYNLTPEAMDMDQNDNACLDHYWELFYAAVDVCNTALEQVEANTQIDSKTKMQYLGEAHFMRAFYYFHLVNIWGDIPYNDAPITSQNLQPVKTPQNEVYGKILADLDESIKDFDAADYRTKADGRANYWAARAFKARVLLYAASWIGGQLGQQVGDNTTYSSMSKEALYTEAMNEADAVIGSNYASFYTNYNDMWSMNNEGYDKNSEALFGITYSQDLKTPVNCIPYRYRTDDEGNPMQYCPLITRTRYTRGGSAMLLMFVSSWNNGATDVGTNGTNTRTAFIRCTGESTSYLPSATTGKRVYVADKYSPYGRGFNRFLPSLHLWQLLEEHKSTDQRCEATLLDHYDVASPDLYGNVKSTYPDMQQDTLIYYSPLDGDSPEGQRAQQWAKNKYRIQFASGGDIPVYTSSDPATAKPTETAKPVSDVYGDKRYNTYKIGGWMSFPGIKKFLDNVYNPDYPSHDVSSRDAIVMRLPELYLIKAECQVALGQGAAAMATINQLRSVRAKAGTDNTLKGNATIDIVLDERAIELCGEQMRWFDLKRTGKLYEYVAKYNAQASPQLNADASHHFLYRPIPQDQMDAITNPDVFKQNPGY